MRNKSFLVFSLLIMVSMVLGACATPTPETIIQTVQVEGETVVVTATPEPVVAAEFNAADPTTFVWATFGDPELIDPALTYETAGGQIIQNTHDTLIFYNRDNPVEFVPMLATEVPSVENGGISTDGLTYTFKIRSGVKFHDGTDMTPEDVAFSLQRGILQGGTASPQWMFAEPFFGIGIDDIAAVVGNKIVENVDAKIAELVATLDVAALTPEVVSDVFTQAAAYYTEMSGFTVDAQAVLDDTATADAVTELIATDELDAAGVSAFIGELLYNAEGGDVGALYDDPAAMQAVNSEIIVAVADLLKSVIVADSSAGTVTMTLAQPWGPFLATLANSWGAVTSKAWVGSMGGWDGDSASWPKYYGKTSEELVEGGLGSQENGTGPFKLDHWTPGEEIVLVANEDYWVQEPLWEGGPTGAPALKTVIIKSIDEFSTRYAMLQAGDADAIQVGGSADYPQMDTMVGIECQKTTDDCQVVDDNKPLLAVKGLEQTSRQDIFYTFQIPTEGNNFIGSGKLDGNGIPPNFFSDPLIRKGFAYCFNYDAYLNDVMLGEAVRSINIMLPGMIGYTEDMDSYTYDPAKCTELLQQSKWTDNGDGTYTPDPAGAISLWDTGFRFTVAYNTGNTSRQTAAQILQAELSAINELFIVEVTGLPWPTFLRNQRASNLPIFISGWLEDIHDPHNWVVPYTTGTYGGRQKMPAEVKAQYAEIISRAVVESDPEKRAEIYKEFNQLAYDTASVITLFVPTSRRYQQRWIEGWYYNPIYPGTYYYPLSKK